MHEEQASLGIAISMKIDVNKELPYLMALLFESKVVEITWNFDEQQADAVHHQWSIDKAQKELLELLNKARRVRKDAI